MPWPFGSQKSKKEKAAKAQKSAAKSTTPVPKSRSPNGESQRSVTSQQSQLSMSQPPTTAPSPSSQQSSPSEAPEMTTYTIAVKTSDVKNAGTDANVYVQLTGEAGTGPELYLKTSLNHRNKFERKRSDVFVFSDQKPLGVLKELKIWHDNSGIGPGWHLQVVEVNDAASAMSYVFPCNQWLCKKEGDRRISRVLACARTKQKIPKQLRVAAEMSQQQQPTDSSSQQVEGQQPWGQSVQGQPGQWNQQQWPAPGQWNQQQWGPPGQGNQQQWPAPGQGNQQQWGPPGQGNQQPWGPPGQGNQQQ